MGRRRAWSCPERARRWGIHEIPRCVDHELDSRSPHAAGAADRIVDHSTRPGTGKEAAQNLHRIDPEFAKGDIQGAGFVFDGRSDVLRDPDDDRTLLVFDDRIRRRTDRFVYRFIKPKARE